MCPAQGGCTLTSMTLVPGSPQSLPRGRSRTRPAASKPSGANVWAISLPKTPATNCCGAVVDVVVVVEVVVVVFVSIAVVVEVLDAVIKERPGTVGSPDAESCWTTGLSSLTAREAMARRKRRRILSELLARRRAAIVVQPQPQWLWRGLTTQRPSQQRTTEGLPQPPWAPSGARGSSFQRERPTNYAKRA